MDEKSETLELYKVMVSTITANEQRRQQINILYITLIGLSIPAVSAANAGDPIYLTVPGTLLSFVWWTQIRFLRHLSAAKWAVVQKLEGQFSVQPFTDEWNFLRKTVPGTVLTDIEGFVPALCFFACFGYILKTVLLP